MLTRTEIDSGQYRAALRDALLVQDACNLSGVVHAWSRWVPIVRERHRESGTDAFAADPVNVLFASKVASLTRCEDTRVFHAAYMAAVDSD